MKATKHTPALIALAVAAALGMGSAQAAVPKAAGATSQAQDDLQCQRSSRRGQAAEQVEERYPDATRQAPTERASSRMSARLNRLNTAMERDEFAQVREQADAILAEERANGYDKSYAANLAAFAAYNEDDSVAAKAYLTQQIELGGLDNTGHFQAMVMLAQLQAQDDEYDASLATLDRYFAESGSRAADDLALRGQVLYQAERYEEAIEPLRQAVETAESPNAGWTQTLMAAYAETGRTAEAAGLAEQIAAAAPDDKRAQVNLAAMYMQLEQEDRAVEVMERLRASGQLTEDREYRNLMAMYLNMDGGEARAIEVINEGLEKGVLEENHQTYLALAQAYYFSEQVEPAIEAYRKAAPLADTGETYLNLARLLYGEGREAEAAEAARQALAKGVNNPTDANRIIGN